MKKLRAKLVFALGKNGGQTLRALTSGFRRHGVEVVQGGEADFYVAWGWRRGQPLRAAGREVLVIERGYLGDRKQYTSFGWNGLNGRAAFAEINDGGVRARQLFGELRPWRTHDAGYALVLGQVTKDTAVRGADIVGWYAQAADVLGTRGWEVRFRAHPLEPGPLPLAMRARSIGGTLGQALHRAALAVTFNSNSGVDAAVLGTPLVALDPGSMAWEVAAHDLEAPPQRPERAAWYSRLAWKQFSYDEISSGQAWEVVRQAAPEALRG